MATSITAITDVEAVNRILSTVGGEKLASDTELSSATISLIANLAYQDLKNSMRDLMSHPWGFNTEYDVELTTSGNAITVGTDVATIDLAANDAGSLDVIIRDDAGTRKLYDRKSHSFTAFTGDTYKTIITYYLAFEDMPEAAKMYVIAMAAVNFQATQVGNAQIDAILRTQLLASKSAFESYEAAQESWSIFDNYDIFKIVSGAQRPVIGGVGPAWWGTT